MPNTPQGIIVATSTVADGSMYNRHDKADPKVLSDRRVFLQKHNITPDQTSRVGVNTTARATVEHETDWCRYVLASEEKKGDGMQGETSVVADALVTTQPGHALLLPVADCIGIALYDPDHRVLMVSHLGRHSLEQQGGTKSVEYLVKNYDTNPARLQVWATASAGKDEYPLWKLDHKSLKEALFEQLAAAGVSKSQVIDDPAETTKDDRYFSFSEFTKGHRTEDGDHCIVAMMI